MPVSYVIFLRERVRDTTEMKTYSQKAQASLRGHRATQLAVYGRQEGLEGGEAQGTVILQFPSFEEAKAWYHSPAYREARRHRLLGADYCALIVEGV